MARILVVDDADDVRLALSMIMEDEGHLVVEGADGEHVIQLARQHRPDLIILGSTFIVELPATVPGRNIGASTDET